MEIFSWVTYCQKFIELKLKGFLDYTCVNNEMNKEIYMMLVISKLLNVDISKFTYCGDCRQEVKNHFEKLSSYFGVITGYCADVSEQRNGTDAKVLDCCLDFKIGKSIKSKKAGFEMRFDGNYQRWKVPKNNINRLLVMYVPLIGYLYIFPTGLIEMIVNREIEDLPFDISNYDNKDIFQECNFSGKTVFYIDCDYIQACMGVYMNKYCNNDKIKRLLGDNSTTVKIDTDDYNKYLENIWKLDINIKINNNNNSIITKPAF